MAQLAFIKSFYTSLISVLSDISCFTYYGVKSAIGFVLWISRWRADNCTHKHSNCLFISSGCGYRISDESIFSPNNKKRVHGYSGYLIYPIARNCIITKLKTDYLKPEMEQLAWPVTFLTSFAYLQWRVVLLHDLRLLRILGSTITVKFIIWEYETELIKRITHAILWCFIFRKIFCLLAKAVNIDKQLQTSTSKYTCQYFMRMHMAGRYFLYSAFETGGAI